MREAVNAPSQANALRRALSALEQMQARLDAAEQARHQPIAVIGMGCRFPGGVTDAESFWQLLTSGGDAVREVPADRWDVDAYYDPDPDAPGKIASRFGAFIDGIDRFDPSLFGITPREAIGMDPQQRLLLEVGWEALENAGVAPDSLSGSATGVFVGIVNSDYKQLARECDGLDQFGAYFSSGNANSIASGRLSYLLGLQGPSVSIDTACSSSLVAVHLAVQSLRSGECRLALAGGVNAILAPESSIAISKYRMLAPDGRCKTFDAAADGFTRGEGCGVVVLKRLSDALADGDRVLAVVRGSGVNQDGPSSGLTAPSGPAQEAVIRAALADARLEPAEVGYVEAHGTGTSLGDPIEVQALAAVLGVNRPRERPLLLGSVKTNVGHLEAAAGVAGLIKLVLCLQNREIPPHLHLNTPNPHIPWDRLPVAVPTERTRLAAGPIPVGGVSSFGFSGTNAHLLVAGAPDARVAGARARPHHLLTISARSEPALSDLAGRVRDHLAATPALALGDVAHTLNAGRAQLPHRLTVRAASVGEARAQLDAALAGDASPLVQRGELPPGDPPRIAFLFTGQGAQFVGMGRQLYESEPVFRAAIERCDEILRDQLERPLLSVLYPVPGEEADAELRIHQTGYTQPALFALEYALSELWKSWGITPAAVLGHSIGEYVAATVAGVMSLEDGLRLIAERARLMQALPAGGGMAAVFADRERIDAAVAASGGRLDIAGENGPGSFVLSGDETALTEATAALEADGARVRRLQVSHAFHSPLMDPVLEPFAAAAAGVRLCAPRLRLVSNVTGQLASQEIASAGYWARHLRAPVRFAEGIRTLRNEGITIFLEVGPSPTLLGIARQCVAEGEAAWVPSLRRGREDWAQMLDGLATLFVEGAPVDWEGFDQACDHRPVTLPTYPFQRQRYWVEEPAGKRVPIDTAGVHPLLGRRLRSALPEKQFEAELAAQSFGFIEDHRVQGRSIVPAAGFAEMALAAARQHFGDAGSPAAVHDLVVREPLAFEADEVRVVQTIVTPEGGFRIASQRNREEEWTLHAVGQLATVGPAEAAAEPIDDVRARCTSIRTAAEHHERMREHGLNFGPAMQGVVEIHRRDGEALGRVRAPDAAAAELGRFGLHPALLDACLQVLAAALPESAVRDPYLPLSFDTLAQFGAAPPEVWSHVTLPAPESDLSDTLRADIRILDDAGVLIAEARGLSLRRFRRSDATAHRLHDWLYELEWQPAPHEAMQAEVLTFALDEIAADAAAALPALAEQHELSIAAELYPQVEVVSTAYVATALMRLGLNLEPGARFSSAEAAGRCAVLPRYQRLLRRWLEILHEDGVLAAHADGVWEVLRAPATADADARAAELLARYPASESKISLITTCGRELDGVLNGSVDPLELLFPGGSLEPAERLYRESPKSRVFNALVQRTIASAVAQLPHGRKLKMLEIGAGTGGTTSSVLPILPADRAEYVFTDISPAFLTRARERFAEFGFVRYSLLDIERSPAEQGFADAQFDIVMAVNVLHATADLSDALRHARSVLAPGGLLVVVEATGPERWIDITFGLTDGWWRFTDTETRSGYPLLRPGGWLELFESLGFAGSTFAPAEAERHHQAILLARADRTAAAAEGGWLVLGDDVGVGALVVEELNAAGLGGVLVPLADATAASLERTIRGLAAGRPLRGIVHLGALETAAAVDPGSLMPAQHQVCGTALSLVQALGRAAVAVPRLWLVTRGAQPVGAPGPLAVEQASLWGFATVLRQEHPELGCATVDLDPAASAADQARSLVAELLAPDGEDRLAIRSGERFAARLVRSRRPEPAAAPADQPVRLQTAGSGVLEELAWVPAERRAPLRGEVEIRVCATGLNFRDVMNALGMRADKDPLGGECSGRIVAVGQGVQDVAVGDEVIAIAVGGFGTYVTVDAPLVLPRPASLSLVEAAAQPLCFLTAHYCLGRIGRIAAGERVLIHAAAGGTGLAAVRLAQHAGAEVFATAGSEPKREFLRALGVRNVFDSRSLDFADQVLQATGGHGVDVVLNSLAGDFIARSVDALAENGRFLEIGKRDIWSGERFAERRPGAEYHVVDLAERLHADPVSVAPVFREAMQALADGSVPPLPITRFSRAEVADAFRFMAQAKHIGKIVVTQDSESGGVPAPRADGTYLITGGLTGIGLLTARWLAGRGAGALALMGRRAPAAAALEVIRGIEAGGTRVLVVQGDVCRADDVRRALAEIDRELPPLRGIVHSAGVLEDGALLRQQWAQFARVLAPKVDGAWLLHTLTREKPLDFFVIYSSIAALLGSAGQGNHASANAFLDALAHHRRAAGLPALSIGWGVWSEIGSAAALGTADRVAARGIGAISPTDGLRVLETLLDRDRAYTAVQPIDWPAYLGSAGEPAPWLSAMVREAVLPVRILPAAAAPAREPAAQPLPERLRALPVEEQRELLMREVHAQVVRVIGLGVGQSVDPRQPLSDLGVDSLMAVELRNRLGTLIGAQKPLPATLVFDHPTISALTDYLACGVLALDWTTSTAPAAAQPVDLLDQIENLSDDEVDRLFAGIDRV
jgi:acyl transferase domain-containing protein